MEELGWGHSYGHYGQPWTILTAMDYMDRAWTGHGQKWTIDFLMPG